MAKHVEQQNAIEMQCAGAARQAEEQKKKIREIIFLNWVRIIFHTRPHTRGGGGGGGSYDIFLRNLHIFFLYLS